MTLTYRQRKKLLIQYVKKADENFFSKNFYTLFPTDFFTTGSILKTIQSKFQVKVNVLIRFFENFDLSDQMTFPTL